MKQDYTGKYLRFDSFVLQCGLESKHFSEHLLRLVNRQLAVAIAVVDVEREHIC